MASMTAIRGKVNSQGHDSEDSEEGGDVMKDFAQVSGSSLGNGSVRKRLITEKKGKNLNHQY